MTAEVCLTVDVEDWYDGMAVLGESFARPQGARSGLADLAGMLASADGEPGGDAVRGGQLRGDGRPELDDLVAHGHEIASHGPDHGRLPDDAAGLVEWLRRGREMIEDVVQRPVQGFRSPRFDIPRQVGLARYRELLAEAGFSYVSDTSRLGAGFAGSGAAGADRPRVPDRRRQLPAAAPDAVRCPQRYARPKVPPSSTTTPMISGPHSRTRRPSARWPWPNSWWGAEGSPECSLEFSAGTEARRVVMSNGDFQTYFQRRAGRFAAFYSSEPVARVLGRGPLFDRLRLAVDTSEAVGAKRVLDVGCGSGPLFAPLAAAGIQVTGIDPADAMVELANQQASLFPDLVHVEQRGWEQITEVDAYDVAVALGVFDYVGTPVELLERMGRAAGHVIASFPSPGIRLSLRKIRYGAQGVSVHGYGTHGFDRLALDAGMEVVELFPLDRAGHVAHFRRRRSSDGGGAGSNGA